MTRPADKYKPPRQPVPLVIFTQPKIAPNSYAYTVGHPFAPDRIWRPKQCVFCAQLETHPNHV